MQKLINGIIDFQKNIRPEFRETFAKLALGQFPDALFITCSDSRVAPNLFVSKDPGDLFVIRNVGNMVAPCNDTNSLSSADESEAAALEYAVNKLRVKDIIICGHSECGAMKALIEDREKIEMPHLKMWLRHGDEALYTLRGTEPINKDIAPHNRLSQINVLQQIEHLKSYPIVQEQLYDNKLRLHAWWFDLHYASVHWYIPELQNFIEIDEKNGQMLLERFMNA